MRLDDFCQSFDRLGFPKLSDHAHPDRESVVRVRSILSEGLVDDELLVDGIARELRALRIERLRRGLVPFFVVPGFGVRMAFGYWPPGGTPGAHEHTAWTITAVCRNVLEVLTYDREESYRRDALISKNRFVATAGKVGFIYEPSIHAPVNTSQDWSLSLHVSSPRDGEPAIGNACGGELWNTLNTSLRMFPGIENHPYLSVMILRHRQHCAHLLARILLASRVSRAASLLDDCTRLASSATCRLIRRFTSPSKDRLESASSWRLARVHPNLLLDIRRDGHAVTLCAQSLHGLADELTVNDLAYEAIAFAVREPIFDVEALPGGLSEEERTAIGDILETTGLFQRVES